jgi:glutamate-1-semialdehyde 2,1-aminomutase
VVPYNDPAALDLLLKEKGSEIACVILEPIAGNMGVIPPAEGYLQAVRDLTMKHGVLMILDEVMTGFRVHPGGAQTRFGITPDLSCFGKVIGGGLPVGAFGGKAELMENMAPTGPIYQAGTLSGNPLAMRAGLETLDILAEDGVYERMEQVSATLQDGLGKAAEEAGVTVCSNRVGSMMTMFFNPGPVTDFESAAKSDTDLYARWFHGMLERGVYLAPSQFEAAFVSSLHGEEEVEATLKAAREVFAELKA